MPRRSLFRQEVLERFQGPFESDAPLTLVSGRRSLVWMALLFMLLAAALAAAAL
jgi:hypothetical protein